MGICGAFGAYAGFSVSTNYGYYVHDGKVGLGAVEKVVSTAGIV